MKKDNDLQPVQNKIVPPLEAVTKGFGFMGTLLCTKDGEKIQCHKCGDLFPELREHIKLAHNLDPRQYKDKYGLNRTTPLISPVMREKYIRRVEKKRMPFWMLNDKTKEEYLTELRRRSLLARKARKKEKKRKYTSEQLNKFGTCPKQIEERFISLYEKKGTVPTFTELREEDNALLCVIYRRFKTYSNFLITMGLKSGRRNNIARYTLDEIKKLIEQFVDEKQRCICPRDTKIGYLPDRATIAKYFEGWMKAKQFSFEYLTKKYPQKAFDYDKNLRRISL